MRLRDYQHEAVNETHRVFLEKQSALAVMATGLGKCQGRGTPILMYDGSVFSVEDIKPGDVLMGPDSEPRVVTSVCSGVGEMYKVTPKKGDSYTVNDCHVLSLKITGLSNDRKKYVCDCNGKRYTNGDIVHITVTDYLRSSKTFQHVAKGYRVGVEFKRKQNLRIPPYILGTWLADGNALYPIIYTPDQEVINEVLKYAEEMQLCITYGPPCGEAKAVRVRSYSRKWHANYMLEGLKKHSLIRNKHIPLCYKTASRKDRLELLAGLLDGDGSLFGGCYDYISVSKQLANDVAYLVRSLGFATEVKSCKKTCCNNGVTKTYYRLCISGDVSEIPCRVPRKQAEKRLQKKDVLSVGIKVEHIGIDNYYGFTLDGNDRRYLMGDFTVTHNTVFFGHIIKDTPKRAMVIAHREELVKAVSPQFE